MRFITYCPFCQTQFIASEQQLNRHDGQVRCGQCLQLFNAKAQILNTLPDDVSENNGDQNQALSETTIQELVAEDSSAITDAIVPANAVLDQPAYLDDIASKNKLKRSIVNKPNRRWAWLIGICVLIVSALAQSVYFLRDSIAVDYPHIKPFLVKACEPIHCKISLPQQIEFLVVDDSDIKEDPERSGLMRFSTTLINIGNHAVAFPNLELTLTDVNEQPVLRRMLTPKQYLTAPSEIEKGLNAGESLQISLPFTTDGLSVAGYRVFVTY